MEVNSYIKRQRDAGVSDQEIAKALETAGWKDQHIKKVLATALEAPEPPQDPWYKRIYRFYYAGAILIIIVGAGLWFFLGGGEDEAPIVPSGDQPALEATRRDTARRGGLLKAIASAENYANSNGGNLPVATESGWQGLLAQVAESYGDIRDPLTGVDPVFTAGEPAVGQIQYLLQVECGDNNSLTNTNNESDYGMKTLLENGEYYCLDNTP